jgi:hypothetical protein
MEKKPAIISCLIIIAMIIAVIPKAPITYAADTKLKLESTVSELGPANAVNTTFKVTCVVENVTNLYGVDIQISWNTEYIAYVSHNMTIPVNTHPGGILYQPIFGVHDDVDESGGLTDLGSENGTLYWLAQASGSPAAKFNGTGTAFEMLFRIKKHPIGVDTDLWINFTSATLADKLANPIACDLTNLYILLHGRTQPEGPEISISSVNYKGAVPHTFDVNVSILNLDSYWDLGGFDVQLSYSPDVLQATNTVVDPDGWFASFWNDTLTIMNSIDNNEGKIWIALLGLPDINGTHTPPYGSARLFTVTFSATGSGPIQKIVDPYSLAAFPHPERPESPFDSLTVSVPIPFTVTNGFAHVIGIKQHTPKTGYTVTTESNSTVSSVLFRDGVPMLQFNVSGPDGYTGYLNITIPKNFIWSDTIPDGWVGLFDGLQVSPTITEDADNTYLYFTYTYTKHSVTIIGQHIVPELGLATITIFMMLSILAIAMMKKLTAGKKR